MTGGEISQAQALFDAGRHREALRTIEALIDDSEQPGELYYIAGCASLALGEASGAMDYFHLASSFIPAQAKVWLGLGTALKASGAIDEAVPHFERAAGIQADGRTLAALGLALLHAGDFLRAAQACERACATDPACVDAWHHRALVERERGDIQAARAFSERALALRPDLVEVRCALAHSLRDLGKSDDALMHYDAVLAHDPQCLDASLNRAHLLLMDERYAEAWEAYEARIAYPEMQPAPAVLPRWGGDASARVLIYGEQGIGDQVMFASCLPDAAARAAATSLVCHPKLVALFKRSFPGIAVYSRDDPGVAVAQKADAIVPIGSLPRIFRRSRDDFPQHRGYLAASPDEIALWQGRFAGQAGPTVGLAWRGGTLKTRGHLRSIDPKQLGPLAFAGSARWISLQYGDAQADCASIQRAGLEITRWPEIESSLEACAAAICAMDLVVTTDNTIAHLAGALGKPVWILLQDGPEWRYGVVRKSLPWYPQAKLWRKNAGETWEPTLAAVARSLKTRHSEGVTG